MIPIPYLVVFITLLVTLGTGVGYLRGRDSGMEKYYAIKATLEMERQQAKANADQARSDSERITGDVSRAWSRAYSYLNDHPRTVRVLRAGCDTGTLRPPASGIPDGITAPATPDPAISLTAEQCEARLNDGIADAAQLVFLQKWLTDLRTVK